ncbi:thioesterase family protein [Actinocorallia lasiicapitis]
MTKGKYRFDTDTEVTATGNGVWSAKIEPGWRAIGGQPNGGYLMALALSAAVEAVPGTQPYSVSAHFLRPGELGPAELTVEVVKLGRVKNTVEVRLDQGGKERLRLLTTLGRAGGGDGGPLVTASAPDLPKPDDCVEAPLGVAGPDADIAERFDYRVTPASRWISGKTSDRAVIEGWIRFSDGREPDLASLPLFADAFPPAAYEVVEAALVPTIEMGVHLRAEPAPGWLQVRFQTRLIAGEILEEDGEIWDSEGRLVAMSRQLALLLPMG